MARALGPVWEANNVWIIFALVVTWTAFPLVYAAVSTALFIPITFALVGIVLRGAAFGFRAHIPNSVAIGRVWGRVFSVTSVIAPFLLGTCAGALASGHIRVQHGQVSANLFTTWTTPFALACGAFALGLCTVLAATYLTVEAQQVSDDTLVALLRLRAIIAGAVTALIGAIAAVLAYFEAPVLWNGLVGKALPLAIGAIVVGIFTATTLLLGHYRLARIGVAAETVCIFAAWAVAVAPYLVVPDLTITNTASPAITLDYLLISVAVGLALVLPSLGLLIHVFKGSNPSAEQFAQEETQEFYPMNEKKVSSPAAMQRDGKQQSKAASSLKSKVTHEAQQVEHNVAGEAATTGVLLALAVALKVAQWGWEQFTIVRIQRHLHKQQRRRRMATPV
ncbi:MAG: cytochrome d ubiquinol oxidase subunit II [Ktedonobacterales bacterium]